MIEKHLEITNSTGLHARPASNLVENASKFKSKITIEKEGRSVDAKSILGILSLGANKGSRIRLTTEGEDEEQAAQELIDLLNSFVE
ncbi:Phosphotransferase system, HPr histidine phosphorylation site [Acididesulfobacillus acetoxydans]|uniref:Phosphocarrier protein HPr n=1 Tax=Acididesulfobacillus acetoxydans TaxID=1561005 RepID=A0A8S0WHZ2_9FIRM|nr:HPr family phosphocarrier protein [Acididesulfobacillus acetoxydans]CAA7603012.1 Phosphotransferase system, HPr histidine phosphorylation site [Acididesulfobacillus acetoxydans]CEJ08608.1 Phosphocarrier protein signature [Acididesulfobacillus acetoxydans]